MVVVGRSDPIVCVYNMVEMGRSDQPFFLFNVHLL